MLLKIQIKLLMGPNVSFFYTEVFSYLNAYNSNIFFLDLRFKWVNIFNILITFLAHGLSSYFNGLAFYNDVVIFQISKGEHESP